MKRVQFFQKLLVILFILQLMIVHIRRIGEYILLIRHPGAIAQLVARLLSNRKFLGIISAAVRPKFFPRLFPQLKSGWYIQN